jgi:hypothetical protein
MGLKSFLKKHFGKKEVVAPIVQEEEKVATVVKTEEPTKVIEERLAEVADKKEEVKPKVEHPKVTAKEIKAKSKVVAKKPVEVKKPTPGPRKTSTSQVKPPVKKPNNTPKKK